MRGGARIWVVVVSHNSEASVSPCWIEVVKRSSSDCGRGRAGSHAVSDMGGRVGVRLDMYTCCGSVLGPEYGARRFYDGGRSRCEPLAGH